MTAAMSLDAAQQAVAGRFDRMGEDLRTWQSCRRGLFASRRPPPRGVYLWGDVGRGKTMLMDGFFQATQIVAKRRVHFHAFMAETHERIHAWRTRQDREVVRRQALLREPDDDPIPHVARAIARQANLLCLDEFQVQDVADAMILGRLFEQLLARDVVMVFTSNTPPARLYDGGLNRQLFLPFVTLIENRMDVIELKSGPDYRLGRMAGLDVYIAPLGTKADDALDRAFLSLANGARPASETITVLGRAVSVPRAVNGTARFFFAEICGSALGATDYIALAKRYDIFVIDHIPLLGPERRNETRRFVLLVDTLYDEAAKLICSAAAPPEALCIGEEDAQSFRRTASRLVEMQSASYLGRSRSSALRLRSGGR